MDMREILFRGKCVDTGNWCEGQYIHLHKTTYCFKEDYERNPNNDIHQIVFERMMDWGLPNHHLRTDVMPETVGQYTGLTDKNGKKIFEGDIVKTDKFNTPNKFYVIKYDLLLGAFIGKDNGTMYFTTFDGDSELFEIIGNIHDNPELLKGGAK
jgi:uncharacterized phage protein (TIGR01671 family)